MQIEPPSNSENRNSLRHRVESVINRLSEVAGEVYQEANRRSGGLLGLVRETLDSAGRVRASEAAAALSFFFFFSLFPLLLALVAIAGFFLGSEQAQQQVIALVTQALPISQNLLRAILREVLDLRGTIGIIGLIGLVWSASGFFIVLAYNINLAWPDAKLRGYIPNRLVGLQMVGGLVILLLLSLASTAIANVLPRMTQPPSQGDALFRGILWTIAANVIPWLFAFILYLALYHGVPTLQVKWKASILAALVISLIWEIGKRLFTWYVSSGWVNYRVVYGSLGTAVALLFWIYLSAQITLLGAHLCATLDQRIKEGRA